MKRNLKEKKITATDLRQNLFSYLDSLQKEKESLVVERNGSPQAVILSFDQYKRALEKKLEGHLTTNLIDDLRTFHKDYLKSHAGRLTSESSALIRAIREEN